MTPDSTVYLSDGSNRRFGGQAGSFIQVEI